jgi:hypothetical protein
VPLPADDAEPGFELDDATGSSKFPGPLFRDPLRHGPGPAAATKTDEQISSFHGAFPVHVDAAKSSEAALPSAAES